MDSRHVGALVIALGFVAIAVGGLIALGWLSWFGRLPGDIRYERGATRVYIPLASMLLVSLLLTAVSYALRRFL